MPIHLPAISRRQFLGSTLAAGASVLWSRQLFAEGGDPNHFVLMADPHICERRDIESRGVKPVPAFEQLGREILAADTRPAAIVVAGDCAFNQGTPGDYGMLGALIDPLRRAGLPFHLTLGNHDHREHFLAAFPDAKQAAADEPPPNKLVSVIETPHANWFLLDSLEKTNFTPGRLGKEQLQWLGKAIDARPDRPALVVAHHNPAEIDASLCLMDTAALFDVLLPRKQVKAYVFGHTHKWRVGQHQGLHLVNLPAVAWAFDPTQPRGFVTAQLHATGATLRLHAFDRTHAKHGEKIDLLWRAA